jgi:hypothetical protein
MKKSSVKLRALRVVGPLLTGVCLLMSPLTGRASLPEGETDVRYQRSAAPFADEAPCTFKVETAFHTSGQACQERDSFTRRHPRADGAGYMPEPVTIAQGSRRRTEQWQHMAPAEKETMRQRMDQWNQMAPQEQQRYQQRYDQWKHLSPDEQRQIDRKLDSWKNLSPSEKEDVRRRFR